MYDVRNIPEDYPWACHRLRFGERKFDPSIFEWLPAGWGDPVHKALDRIEALLREHELLDCFTITDITLDECLLFVEYRAHGIDETARTDMFFILTDLYEELLETCWRCGKKGPVGMFGSGSYVACIECADVIQQQKALLNVGQLRCGEQ